MSLLVDARHQVASAAGDLAACAAQVARALAWSAIPEHSSALISDLDTCIRNIRLAEERLIAARERVRIAQESV